MSHSPAEAHNQEQSTFQQPLADELQTAAGALALRIAEVAAHHRQLRPLGHELTSLLQQTLDAEEVVLFWRQPPAQAAGHRRTSLSVVASTRKTPDTRTASGNHLKATAYRALSQRQAITRLSHETLQNGSEQSLRMQALPIGTDEPWAVLVASWRPAGPVPDMQRAALLVRLAPSLEITLRPARVAGDLTTSATPDLTGRAVFAVTSEAILTMGGDLIIHQANPAFGRLLEWPESSIIGTRCQDMLHCHDHRGICLCDTLDCPAQAALGQKADSTSRELHWRTRTGKLREVSANFTASQPGTNGDVIVVAREVTAGAATNRTRGNFISMVSHELRTPLHAINGFLEIVLDGQVGPLNERQQEFLNYARVSTQQLTTLVEDILFISKADSGQFTLRLGVLKVADLLQQVTQALATSAAKADIHIVTESAPDLPLTYADELRLQQVLSNLLNNAIKFSPAKSVVHVMARRAENSILFEVKDSGKGIAPEDHARIFERFYQAENASRTHGAGYGLGLAVARLIVEQHEGRIWVESEPGQGARFCFTVPIREPDA